MIFDGSSRRIGGRDGRNAIAAHPREDVVALTECQDLSERHHKHFVAAGENRWPVRDDDDGALFALRLASAPASALSPSSSRLEFGSSRMTRAGLP